MDNGSFRDSQGRVINCQHLLVIMTSNLGASDFQKRSVGLSSFHQEVTAKKVLENQLRPEFINRFDSLISFNILSKDNFSLILEKQILELNNLVAKNNLVVELDAQAKAYLISESEREKMGARPLKRLIENTIKQNIALKVLEGVSHQRIRVVLESQKLVYYYDNL
jgi:ATP-dependent Clp protease ATP-binding subunit ClpA